jgi:hypothetical protein
MEDPDRYLSKALLAQLSQAESDGLNYLTLTAMGKNKEGSAFLGQKLAIYALMVFFPEE